MKLLVTVLITLMAIFKMASSEIKTVDMSHEYIENITYFYSKGAMLKRYPSPRNGQHEHFWLSSFNFFMGEHGGTHLDAPAHFCEKCKTMEQIPLSDLLSLPLCILNVSNKTKDNPDYGIKISDFEEWEKQYGRIPEGSAVFTNMGWQQYYPDRKTFLGSDIEDPTLYHHPGYEGQTVVWLAEQRKVKGIGLDGPSLDVGQNMKKEAHTALLTRNLWGAEVVANMDKVPPSGARVSILPTKFRGGSGASSRIFAVWNTDSGASKPFLSVGIVFLYYVSIAQILGLLL